MKARELYNECIEALKHPVKSPKIFPFESDEWCICIKDEVHHQINELLRNRIYEITFSSGDKATVLHINSEEAPYALFAITYRGKAYAPIDHNTVQVISLLHHFEMADSVATNQGDKPILPEEVLHINRELWEEVVESIMKQAW